MRATLLISMWILFAVDTARPQPTSLLLPGTRVRLTTRSSESTESTSASRIGSVIAAGPDSLKIRFPDLDSTSTVAWSGISRLEVSHPVPLAERAETGAIVGGLVGAVIGGVVGAGKDDRRELIDPTITGAAEGLVYGAVVGGALGAISSAERWERVWPLVAFREAARPPRRRYFFGATPTFARP